MLWFKSRRSKGCALSDVGERLGSETEAFLSGGLAEELRRCGDVVPGWAWLNVLAHGELGAIKKVTRASLGGVVALGIDDPEASWKSARRTLAEELVALVADDGEVLARIQRAALVPLELRLMRLDEERGLSAFDLVQATRSALRSSIA